MELTEQGIALLAPNPAAAANGKKLSTTGKFSNHGRTADGTLWWANCAGSGARPYLTSVDFTDPSAPLCRCSCPSRQFPCKHALGLMYEMLGEKDFPVADVPQQLAEKRERRAARQSKKKAEERDAPAKASASAASAKRADAARKKLIEKQLEGLEMAQRMVNELLASGLSTLAGSNATSYEKLAKDLGSSYLTGPQLAFTRIAQTVKSIQGDKDHAEERYREALRTLLSLEAVIKRSRSFLEERLEAQRYTSEDTLLFEALGGVWRLDDLIAIGSCKENARLVQLSFDVSYDEARREYVERGYWIDLDTGRIDQTLNYRPIKALKYVKADDSCFDLLEVPLLCVYPGEGNRRIRWDGAVSRHLSVEEAASIPGFASQDLSAAVKEMKNLVKSPLLPKFCAVLLSCGRVGTVDGQLVMEDPSGSRIALCDRPGADSAGETTDAAKTLLSGGVPAGSALFGLLFYDEGDRRICLQPYSLVTPESILRFGR